ncbi:MAG: bifunctional 2-polyprenyl-6-hydroxyphenol methylase/3-demethylubiquinol 3-O-methyltransferase UbiG [Gammaproteobacteria bacterium]|nr:bifunctional 2-polyprenyl-6-hydroxyphenol methylase/3-demethylubiquinol 3-O-methyltransferase UbiG [Gammaproteobacteria bacterium]
MSNTSFTAANTRTANVDRAELERFSALAQRWWDPDGPGRTLHDINPLRLEYIRTRTSLAGARVLDLGCGGGILTEALAAAGADVTGIDASDQMIQVADLHAASRGLALDYRHATADAHARDNVARYDAIACMELLEHVPDPGSLLTACRTLLRPGGRLFLSTLNRTAAAYLLAVVGAEYLLGLLPRGTHDYARFIRPSELAHWCRDAGLELCDLAGMAYNPITRQATLRRSVQVNYLACCERPE